MSPPLLPPKPPARPGRVSLWRYVKLFRRDLLSAQPAKLYRAWMAEFKTPFFRSYLVNQPELVDLVLKRRPRDFPKSNRVSEGLRPLLGNSVFLTNGAEWERQRRIIDPAFEGGVCARPILRFRQRRRVLHPRPAAPRWRSRRRPALPLRM